MSEKKEDRRVRRTKKLLTQGLIQLLQQKRPQEITVRELADWADVNRGTFYLYYRDIFDMLEQVEGELLQGINQIILNHQDEPMLSHTRPVLDELFRLIADNQALCRALLSNNGDIQFLQKLSDVIQDRFRNEWRASHQAFNETEFDYRYAFGALGFIGLTRFWLERGCQESASDMASLADTLIRQGITPSP